MMNRFVSNRKCLVFCLVSFEVLALTALGGVESTDNNSKLLELLDDWDRISKEIDDRRALEAYAKKGSEIVPWTKDAALPKPDNAALLYYQAFLLRPDPNVVIREKIHDILFDAEPDNQIRMYLGYCRPMIRTAELASQIPQCSWGLWYGSGSDFGNNALHQHLSNLSYILVVDAHTLATDGHYRAALARCLTLRRIARHVGNDTYKQSLIARSLDSLALRAAQYVLGLMPPDVETLTWFRGQLSVARGAPLSFGKTFVADFEYSLYGMQTNPKMILKIRNELMERAETQEAKEKARNMTTEQLLSPAREAYTSFRDAILRVEDSDMSYNQKYREMQKLADEVREEYVNDPAAGHLISWGAANRVIAEGYDFQVQHEAHVKGIKAAVEIYLVLAKTGKLPEKLPDHLPNDPFTSEDFVYEITDDGFVLRCQGEEFLRRKNKFLEFKIRR